MSMSLRDVLDEVRSLHPAFDATRVPNVTLAQGLGNYQNTLIGKSVLRDKMFLSQTLGLVLGATTALLVDDDAGTPVLSDTDGTFVQFEDDGTPFVDPSSLIAVRAATFGRTVPVFGVELEDDGTPFVSPTSLSAQFEGEIALPMILALIGGTVYFNDGGHAEPLCITSWGTRLHPRHFPAVYMTGTKTLGFCGNAQDWQGVTSVELRYSPIAPPFAGIQDFFLLPDQARQCLVAYGAKHAAVRAGAWAQKDGPPAPDLKYFAAEAVTEENNFLSTLRINKRARGSGFREEHY